MEDGSWKSVMTIANVAVLKISSGAMVFDDAGEQTETNQRPSGS